MSTAVKQEMWRWDKRRNLLTGFYSDPLEDKKSQSTVYVPNMVFYAKKHQIR